MGTMRFILGLGILMLLAGCGYTFVGGTSILPPDVKRIYIPFAENNSQEAGLTTLFTEALRDQFERYGVVTVVESIGEADAVLRSRIVRVKLDTDTVTSNTEQTLQQDATMTVAAELRRVTGPILWRNADLKVSRNFGTQSGAVITSSPDFASGTLGGSDLAQLESTGTREVARGQQSEALNFLADEAALVIYDSAVSADF